MSRAEAKVLMRRRLDANMARTALGIGVDEDIDEILSDRSQAFAELVGEDISERRLKHLESCDVVGWLLLEQRVLLLVLSSGL